MKNYCIYYFKTSLIEYYRFKDESYNMNIKVLLGKRIKEIRKRHGYTQEKLAELADIEIPSLSNIENAKNYPNSETLEKLCNALSLSPYELFMFDYYKPHEVILDEIYSAMKADKNLAEKIYKFYLCIK